MTNKKNNRDDALGNGIILGYSSGCFFAAVMTYIIELGNLFYVSTIAGIVLLAIGIRLETYERTRR